MLPFATKTITLYNRVEIINPINNKSETVWNRTILNGCSWNKSLQSLQVGNIEISSDDYIVKIPESTKFLEKWDYEKLPLEDQKNFFTVSVDDIVILGAVETDIDDNTSATELKEIYHGRELTAKGFFNNGGAGMPLPHYEIVGA